METEFKQVTLNIEHSHSEYFSFACDVLKVPLCGLTSRLMKFYWALLIVNSTILVIPGYKLKS